MGQERTLEKIRPRVLIPTDKGVVQVSSFSSLLFSKFLSPPTPQRVGQTGAVKGTDGQTRRTDTKTEELKDQLGREEPVFARDQTEESGQESQTTGSPRSRQPVR